MADPALAANLLLAIESEAARFYEALARRFAERPELRALWTALATDEQEHAQWIRRAGERVSLMDRDQLIARLPDLPIAQLKAVLREITRQRERAEVGAYSAVEALAATIALETSEVNDTLADFVAAIRSPGFPDPFAVEMSLHLRRLTEAVDRLSHPELTALLKGMAAKAERQLARGRTILVVDDEADMVETCARIFRRSGDTCVTTTNPQDALALVQRVRPNLILTDLRMPGVDGLMLLRQIKQVAPDVPVVIFTAYVSEASVREALEAGAAAYLPKPFTAAQLRLTVERVLGSSGNSVQ